MLAPTNATDIHYNGAMIINAASEAQKQAIDQLYQKYQAN